LNPWGRYRGPGGADPTKTREQREQELRELLNSKDGCEIVLALYREAQGGQAVDIGTPMTEMIPSILNKEYQSA
jgi:hypothetical protein